MLTTRLKTIGFALLICTAIASVHAQDPAQEQPKPEEGSLAFAMQSLASDVAKELGARKETAIAMGAFDSPAGSMQNMQALLKTSLEGRQVVGPNGEKSNITVGPSGAWRISGEVFRDGSGPELTAVVETKLKDRSGRAAGQFRNFITNQPDLIKMFNPASVNLEQTPVQQRDKIVDNKALEQALDAPDFEVTDAGSGIRPKGKSPFEVIIEVEDPATPGAYVPLLPVDKNGLPFVDIQPGQNYAVRVINHSGESVGVEVAVDGINMFAFSRQYAQVGKLFMGKNTPETQISGWHFTDGAPNPADPNTGTKQFTITSYGQSAQALFGAADLTKLGTITVIFYQSWLEGEQPPPQPAGARAAQFGTGFGKPTPNTYKPVRCFSAPCEPRSACDT